MRPSQARTSTCSVCAGNGVPALSPFLVSLTYQKIEGNTGTPLAGAGIGGSDDDVNGLRTARRGDRPPPATAAHDRAPAGTAGGELSTVSGDPVSLGSAWRPPRVHVTVVDAAARAIVLEVKVKLDVVEWWLGGRCLAAVDKERLREWVGERTETVLSGELTLVHTRLGPIVEVPGVLAPSPLTPTAFLDLRDALA